MHINVPLSLAGVIAENSNVTNLLLETSDNKESDTRLLWF